MKLKSFLVIALVAFMASCTSTDDLVKDYVAACKEGDTEKIEELRKELEEVEDELTDEQKADIVAALDDLVKDYVAACKEGDSEKMEELVKELEEVEDELTEEQKTDIAAATFAAAFGSFQ
jgi:uncharacterized membrane protein YvbJ